MSEILDFSKKSASNGNICRICGLESDKGQILFNFNQQIEQRAVEICSYISIQMKYICIYPNWICPGCELQFESTNQFFELIKNGQKLLCEKFGGIPRRGRKPKKKVLPSSDDDTQSNYVPGIAEDGTKRTTQTPPRLKDAMKGEELEELYTEIGLKKRTKTQKKSKTKLIAHIENEEGNSLGDMLAIPNNSQRTSTRYQCIVCKELFCVEVAFFKHVATHNNIQYECTECERSFISKSLFDEHQLVENHNGLGIIETPFQPIPNDESSQPTEAISSTNELVPVGTKEPSTQTTKTQLSKRYKCFKCSKSFTTKHSMQRHQVAHSNARPYKCDFCLATFKQRSTLAVHRNSHTRERRFNCSKCPKSFIYQQTLRVHLRMHDGLKPYVCSVCKKGFRQMINLVEHKRIHTGERPYVCLICGSAFKTSSQCSAHQKVHKNADERPPKPLQVDTILKTHSCRLCDKVFTHKSAMVKHLRTHTGEKPYVCYLCPKTFADPSNFKKHKKVHAKQKEKVKQKSVSLLKRSQPQIAPSSDSDPDQPASVKSVTPPEVQVNRSMMDILDEDIDRTSKTWGLLRESSDPIITEIQNVDEGVGQLAQPTLSNQLVCVSYQDPLNPVTSKTTFYVVN